jgi:hypothetical protein
MSGHVEKAREIQYALPLPLPLPLPHISKGVEVLI